MDLGLKGRTVLLTSESKAIGYAVGEQMAADGS